MRIETIETARLRLVPYAPEHLLALIESETLFAARFGLPAAAGLREYLVSDEVSPTWLARLRAATAPDIWEHGFAIVLPEAHCVIGGAGFAGAPDDAGVVEIAYAIAPAFEGRGYATETARAAVAFAFRSGRVRRVCAHTLPTNQASMRVLTKCGFTHVGTVEHREDGLVSRWERGEEAASPDA